MKQLAVLCLAGLLLGACGGNTSTVQTGNTTVGQELLDLKRAYEAGIITEKEYERAKRRILRGR